MMMCTKLSALLFTFVLGAAHGFASASVSSVLRLGGPLPSSRALPKFVKVPRGGGARTKLTSSTGKSDLTPEEAKDMLAFLVVKSMNELNTDIAKNWGFILQGGIVKLLAGITALFVPIFATEVAYISIAIATFVQGCFNTAGLFYEGEPYKMASLLVGLAQIFLSYRMYYKPFTSLVTLTLLIAATSVAEGTYQGVVALKNRDIPGWGSLLFSGAVSIIAGVFVARNLAAASLIVLGVMFGSHLISGGLASIGVAMRGREIAIAAIGD